MKKKDEAGTRPVRIKRAEKTRVRILKAARELCAEYGVEGLTMRALAERVDYSATALYRYFRNKDELVAVLSEESWKRCTSHKNMDAEQKAVSDAVHAKTAGTSSFFADQNLLGELIKAGQRLYDFSVSYPADYRFMMNPVQGFPADMDSFKAHPSFRELVDLISAARVSGTLKVPEDCDDETVAFFCFTVIHGAAMLRMGLFKDLTTEWDKISRRVIECAAWLLG